MTDYPLPYVSNDLTGQVAFVTGATSGLGRRFANVLAKCGAKVAIAGRRKDRLDEVKAEIAAFGGVAHPIPLDVGNMQACIDAIGEAEKALGLVTILVNNAGMPDPVRPTKASLELIDEVFNVNMKAPFVLSCEVARRLIAAKSPGRIVNIASVAAFRYGGNGAALYPITKAGLIRITEALAVEWSKQRINVNAIAPGLFDSEMTEAMFERVGDISKENPRGRMGVPAQLDSTLLYFVSPASECVTGTYVKVDDGQGTR